MQCDISNVCVCVRACVCTELVNLIKVACSYVLRPHFISSQNFGPMSESCVESYRININTPVCVRFLALLDLWQIHPVFQR
jgi:hypothetical protein